ERVILDPADLPGFGPRILERQQAHPRGEEQVGPAVHPGDLRTPPPGPPRACRGRSHHDVRMSVYDHDAQLVTEGTGNTAPGGAPITSSGSWPRSCSSTIAALRPGAPVMEPPGCVDPPVW